MEPARLPSPSSEAEAAADALVAALPFLTTVAVRTQGVVAEDLTLPQVRVVSLVATNGAMTVTALAARLRVNPSNAGRTCEQLVARGLLHRSPHGSDRRSWLLELSSSGAALIAELTEHRRRAFAAVVARMRTNEQRRLARGLAALSSVADELGDDELGAVPDPKLDWLW